MPRFLLTLLMGLAVVAAVVVPAYRIWEGPEAKTPKPDWIQIRDNAEEGDIVVNEKNGELIGRITQTPISHDPEGREYLEIHYFIAANNVGYRILAEDDYLGGWTLVKPGGAFMLQHGMLVPYDQYVLEFNKRRAEDGGKYYDLAEPKTK